MRLVARTNYISEFRETYQDFLGSFARFPLAFNLAFQDILARYRGSVLGPWWITLATGSLVFGIGFNYAGLFHQSLQDFLPYVATGIVTWGLISTVITEGGEAFVNGAAMLRQSCLPLPLFIIRCLIRNLINFAHQIIIIVAVLFWFMIFPGWGLLWALLGLGLIIVNLAWLSLVLALASAKFRDIPQIIVAVIQFVFFVSPIFWKPTPQLQDSLFVRWNPFYQSVQLIRAPLLTGNFPYEAWLYLVSSMFIGWVVALSFYNQTRRRIVHYL